MRRILLLVAASLFLAAAAGATDGVLEINQACAVNTGCFSGDAAGWPVEITTPGSYLLTSNLVLPGEDDSGIAVAAHPVSIDLGGFEIVTAACLGASSDCTPAAGSGRGVYSNRATSVKNGSITGMGGRGVYLGGSESEVTNVRARWNAGTGIQASDRATVSASSAYGNGDYGILTGVGSSISGNTVYGNATNVMYISNGSTISGNSVYENGSRGILANAGSTISGNTVYGNASVGIQAGAGSAVSGNTVRNNSGVGLVLVGDGVDAPGYAGNVFSGNGGGIVSGGAEFGENVCNGDTTCP